MFQQYSIQWMFNLQLNIKLYDAFNQNLRGIMLLFQVLKLQYRQMQSSKNTNKLKDKSEHIKSKKCEGKPNNFNFLIQSIERQKYGNHFDKQNQETNQGRYSVKTKPIYNDKSSLGNSGLVNHLSHLRESKQRQNLNNNSLIDSMIYKTKKYLSITQCMLHNPFKIQEKMRKQGINTACQLIEVIKAVEQKSMAKKNHQLSPYSSLNSTGNLVLGSNKSLSSSYHFPNGVSSFEDSANFIRKIENLEQQKLYLESLISQHERTNIKMFIKLNEGESQEIQQYKKQLASLFEKYKQLQKIIRRQSQKSKTLQLKLQQSKSSSECGKLCQLNTTQLKKKISSLEQIITEQNQSLGIALDQLQELKTKIERYRTLQSQVGRKSLHPEKILLDHKQKHISRLSQIPSNDLAKSICSQLANDSVTSKNHFRSISTQTHPLSFHVPIKENTQSKPDQNILRMLLAQASFLDLILKK